MGWLGSGLLQLVHPVTVAGRRYTHWYSAEAAGYGANLRPGTHVRAGQRVGFTRSGWQETGFYAGQPLSGDKRSVEGEDFLRFIETLRARGDFAPGA